MAFSVNAASKRPPNSPQNARLRYGDLHMLCGKTYPTAGSQHFFDILYTLLYIYVMYIYICI